MERDRGPSKKSARSDENRDEGTLQLNSCRSPARQPVAVLPARACFTTSFQEVVRKGGAKGRGWVLQAAHAGGHFAVNGRCTPLVFHTLMKESLEAEIRLPARRRR